MRAIRLAVLLVAMFALAGCVRLDRTFVIPANLDVSVVPANIRSQVASDFPGYRIVDAVVDKDDVLLTLRAASRAFYMAVDYRNPAAYSEPPGPWYYVVDVGGLDMRERDDPRVASLVDFFAARFPRGERVFDGAQQANTKSDSLVYEVALYPARSTDSSGGGRGDQWAETYRYDPASKSWSLAK